MKREKSVDFGWKMDMFELYQLSRKKTKENKRMVIAW
jgi:hypothetical protein